MNPKRLGCIIGRLIAVSLVIALGACTTHVQSDPTTFDVREDAVPRLRGQQHIALKNAYSVPMTVVVLRQGESKVEADLKEFTDTAIGILERRMKKEGITIDAGAVKSVTLRLRDASVLVASPFAVLSTVTVEAELGNGIKREFRVKNNSFSAPRALDGAALRGITELLKDGQFLVYVNGQ